MVSEKIMFSLASASWSSIFAGTATAIAISIVMATLGVALGFSVVKPKSDHPVSGLGMAFGGWSFISVLLSMAGGGFIAGLFAGQKGVEHGFMVWAVTIIAAMLFSGAALGGALKLIGAAVKNVGSGLAGAATNVGGGATNAVSGLVSEIRENVRLDVDTDKISGDIAETLRDTGIETLRPDYLKARMREAKSDLRGTLHQLALTPGDYDRVIADFLDRQSSRVKAITKDIDRQEAVAALMRTRNLPRQDAETMVDNAISAYQGVLEKAENALDDARAGIKDVKNCLGQWMKQAREKADQAASVTAKAALIAAVAMIVAALVSMGAAYCGAQSALGWRALQAAAFM